MSTLTQTAAYQLPFHLDQSTNSKLATAFLNAYTTKRVVLDRLQSVDYRCVYEIPLTRAWDNATEKSLSPSECFDQRHDTFGLTWDWNPDFPYLSFVFKQWFNANLAKHVTDKTFVVLRMQARNTKIPRHTPKQAAINSFAKAALSITQNYAIHIPITCNDKGYGMQFINDRKVAVSNKALFISDNSTYYSPPTEYFQGRIIVYGVMNSKRLIQMSHKA